MEWQVSASNEVAQASYEEQIRGHRRMRIVLRHMTPQEPVGPVLPAPPSAQDGWRLMS